MSTHTRISEEYLKKLKKLSKKNKRTPRQQLEYMIDSRPHFLGKLFGMDVYVDISGLDKETAKRRVYRAEKAMRKAFYGGNDDRQTNSN